MATTTSLGTRRHVTIGVESATLFAGWIIGSLAAALAEWVLVPTLILGWEPIVITPGSMGPTIGAGDVVVVDPEFDDVGPGSVVAYRTGDGVTVHRVHADPDGGLVTKGDANSSPDSTTILPDQLVGVGRLLVPHIGMLRTAGWFWLAAFTGLIATTLFLSGDRRFPSLATSLVVALAVTSATGVAAFATTTSSSGSSASALDLAPPTKLSAACGLIGSGSVNVNLTWTASPSPGLSGYRIYHDGPTAGANFITVGTVTAGETAFTHVVTSPLTILGSHTYLARAISGGWESESSNTDAVTLTQVALAFACTPD